MSRGQGVVEYGLILAIVVLVCVVGLTVFGPDVSRALSEIGMQA